MKSCDVCGSKLGLMKFRYASGDICKSCYETASRSFTETIRELTLVEIKNRCSSKQEYVTRTEDFEITKRIGNYILIDEVNKKFCVLNNEYRAKEYCLPKFCPLSDVKCCKVSCIPEGDVVASLGIELFLYSQTETQKITFFSSPIRRKSYAFRQTNAFFEAVVSYFESNGVACL